ncbi:MAG: PaaI family thioesterase [Actinomycetota bacterium]|nr:PaaI family thioesterase [Actinomycetota bacterium]
MSRTRWEAYLEGAFSIPANETLGFQRRDAPDPNEVAFTWTVPAELCNSAGNLQGGMLAAFADAVLGGLCATQLDEDSYPALAEMKISFLRPAPAGATITGTGRLLKVGKRLMFAEAEITDSDGRMIAKISGTELPASLP